MRRGACCRQQPCCPFPRRGRGWLLVRTVMTSRRRAAGTDPATRRLKHALLLQTSASPHCEQPSGGPGREQMPVGTGKVVSIPQREEGVEGAERQGGEPVSHSSSTEAAEEKSETITRGRLETFSSLLFHGQTPFSPIPP